MKVKNKLRRIVNKLASQYHMRISDSTDLKAQIGLDSLELVLMMNYIEDEFKIELDDQEFLSQRSFGDVVRYVNEQCRVAA